MLLSELEYARPTSVDEAIGLLARHENARALAGGQTLINVMKLRFAVPELVVDLNGIEALRGIGVATDGSIELGAMVTYDEIENSQELRDVRPVLGQVAAAIADQQVRNRGTIGGNICAADPTNHYPPLIASLGATMTIAGAGGERTVGSDDFFVGVYETAVAEGELLTKITIPPPGEGQGDGYASLTIGRDGTGIVNVAATLRSSGPLEDVRVAVGCVAAQPVRAATVEKNLEGADPTEARVREAVQGLGETLDPPGDVHATADYRRHGAEVMTVRAVLQAIERAWEGR